MGFPLFLVYLVFVFLRPTDRFPELAAYPVMTALAALALAGGALRLLMGGGPSFRAPQIYLVLAFFLWAAFSVVAARRWLGGAAVAFQQLQPQAILFIMVILNIDTLRRLRATVVLLVLILMLVVLEGAAGFHYDYGGDSFVLRQRQEMEAEDASDPFGGPERREVLRVRGLGELNDPNDLAQAIVSIFPFVFLAWRRGRWLRNAILVWLPTAGFLYGISLTRSRGGVLALLVVIFFLVRRRLGRVLAAVLAGAGAVGLLALGFTGGRAMALDESASGRTAAWSEGIQMLKSSPIWGVGYNNFAEIHHLVAHNSFVHCFAEVGLVGYFLWLGILILTLAETRVVETLPDAGPVAAWARTAQISLLGFLAAAWFLSRTYSTLLFVLIALATAVIDLARRQSLPVRALGPVSWALVVLVVQVVTVGMFYVVVQFTT